MTRRRVVPGTGTVVTSVVYGPDAWSMQAASLGIMTNTFSPASAGIHDRAGGSTSRGYSGDPGYGVNRASGRTAPLQHFAGAVSAISSPSARRLGIGAGTSGQPGLPNTGTEPPSALARMSLGSVGLAGLGG